MVDADLRQIAGLRELRSLTVNDRLDVVVSDEGVKNLRSLKKLRNLWLGFGDRSRITDDSLGYLAELTDLEELELAGPSTIRARASRRLPSCEGLERFGSSLALSRTTASRISDCLPAWRNWIFPTVR